ncbi:BQ2448_5131 [Microbotryum intermedium]|uniref:BQ2448_5131 protein n=1 Tax=Microbotryum intermedium TaxID=269621 RepID=A0A238F069_9BASI|nr:BQ2448_5131 [Microbotryum intermedium]
MSVPPTPHSPVASLAAPAPGAAFPIPPQPAAGGGVWTKAISPDGRPFYNHSITKESVWEKPSELKTPAELEAEKTPWKEYEANGRPCTFHETKETTWTIPPVIQGQFGESPSQRVTVSPIRPPLPHSPLPPQPALSSMSPNGRNPNFQPPPMMPMRPPMNQMSPPHPQLSAPLPAGGGALVGPGAFVPSGANAVHSNPMAADPMHRNSNHHHHHQQQQQQQHHQHHRGDRHDERDRSHDRFGHDGIPRFRTFHDAEAAFMDMLGAFKVDASWSWEQVMKETITDPYYKALKTLTERKAAFEKYLIKSVEREREEREASLERCRKEWTRALEKLNGGTLTENGVKSWWSFERAKRELENKVPEVWAMPRNDGERKDLFKEFIEALKEKEEATKKEVRTRNLEKLTSILRSLNLDLAGPLRWQEACSTIVRTPEWHRGPELQKIEPLDILNVFEEQVKIAEKEAIEGRARQVNDKKRRARKARDGFKELLNELKESGHIISGTTWHSIHPVIENDPRYLELVGQPGSSPLELFWDLIDELDQVIEEHQRVIETILSERKSKIEEPTTYDEYRAMIDGDERVHKIDQEIVRVTFEKLHTRVVRQNKEERRKAERKVRILVDDLKYAYKKLDPPVELGATYEELLPRIQDAPEFVALTDEAQRRLAHEKFMRRLKEKLQEREGLDGPTGRHESERSRGGHESRERDRDRDRDRGSRSSRHERARRGSWARDTSEGPPLESSSTTTALASKRTAGADHEVDDARKTKHVKLDKSRNDTGTGQDAVMVSPEGNAVSRA